MTRSSLMPRVKRSSATGRARVEVQRAEGFLGVTLSSAQVKAEKMSVAEYCQTVPLVPESRPM